MKMKVNSPFTKTFLHPKMDQNIHCAMGLRYTLDVDALKNAFANSIMIHHPRFSSLMVVDHTGEHWIKTCVNIDDHFIVHHHEYPTLADPDEVESAVNAYLADIAVSTPLNRDKPLWEVHVLVGLGCIVLRVHHGVGDGASLMSMLSACFGKKKEENNDEGNLVKKEIKLGHKWKKGGIWGFIKTLWFSMIFVINFVVRSLLVKDVKSVIYGGDGVELWPRKLDTLKFSLQDFKSIKHTIPDATVNDVFLGVISSGLSKYIRLKSANDMLDDLKVTAALSVNLRQNSRLEKMEDLMGSNKNRGFSSWGNKVGVVLLPFDCGKELHPLEHVKKMKAIMSRKKHSYEAHLVYIFHYLLVSIFGSKAASWCFHRGSCNTTFGISNIMGPSEELVIAGNPVTYLRVNVSSMPQAIILQLVSYAGRADLQVMVAKDIITDSQLLANCFKDSLTEIKKTYNGDLNL